MNGCLTKTGITYDLETLKKVGGSSVLILQNKWNGLMRFSLDECNRLEMDFGTHNTPGWSSSRTPTLDGQYLM
ncbi:MAG: hypothetical protein ACK5L7_03730 [Paludibacteraceae bacterium]